MLIRQPKRLKLECKFGQPEVNLGLIPGFGGTQRLSRLIGEGKVKEIIFTVNPNRGIDNLNCRYNTRMEG